MNAVIWLVSHSLYPCFSGVLEILKKIKTNKINQKKFIRNLRMKQTAAEESLSSLFQECWGQK